MPLPDWHIESLERLLKNHEAEIKALHASLEAIERDIAEREKARDGDKEQQLNAKVYAIPDLMAEHERIQRQIQIQEMLIALGRNPRILDVFGELIDKPYLASEAANDLEAFAKARDIEIPVYTTIEIEVKEKRVSLRIEYNNALSPFVLLWNSNDGFRVPDLEPQQA